MESVGGPREERIREIEEDEVMGMQPFMGMPEPMSEDVKNAIAWAEQVKATGKKPN